MTNWGRNEDEDEKVWENEFNFLIIHIKIRLYGNFHENPLKKMFEPFFRTFLTNWSKNEDEDEKMWENEFHFEYSISKLGYVAIFMKIGEKNFWPTF